MSDDTGVIVDYLRTPFAKAGNRKKTGAFQDAHPTQDLTVPLVNELLHRTGLAPNYIDKLLLGAVHQEGVQGLNPARITVLGDTDTLGYDIAASSVDMFCASSLETVAMADAFVARRPQDVYIAAGVQSMSQIPMGGFNPDLPDAVHSGNAPGFMNMGITAEELAARYDISRLEQDMYALTSHRRAHGAQLNGAFDGEIMPLLGVSHDDGIKPDITMEDMVSRDPCFKSLENGGTVTAATSSQVTDGAAALIVTSQGFAQTHNLPVKARILATGETGLEPEIMGLGPVEASKRALNTAGLSMDDIDRVELNEAFAAQNIAVMREWENQGMGVDHERVNLHGGAIAIGHPLGASGARLVGHLAHTLQQENARYGLATLCVGGGQGRAMVIENPNAPKPG